MIANSCHLSWNLCFATFPLIDFPWSLHALFWRAVLFTGHLDVDVALSSMLLRSWGEGSYQNRTQMDGFVGVVMVEPQVDSSWSGRGGKTGTRLVITNLNGYLRSHGYIHTNVNIVQRDGITALISFQNGWIWPPLGLQLCHTAWAITVVTVFKFISFHSSR